MISRRKLIGGLACFVAAPAIIRVADLMPIKVQREILVAADEELIGWDIGFHPQINTFIWGRLDDGVFSITRIEHVPPLPEGHTFIPELRFLEA